MTGQQWDEPRVHPDHRIGVAMNAPDKPEHDEVQSGGWTWLGIAIIVGSGVYIALRERALGRRKARLTAAL